MFCPNCKSEYRPGFRECSDCQVALVDSLPAGNSPDAESDANSQAAEMLWSGDSPHLRDKIGTALDAAHIPYADESHEVNWLPAIEDHPRFEIWILRANREEASKIIAEMFPDEGETSDTSGTLELSDSSDEGEDQIAIDDQSQEIDPEDATCQVWSGDDSRTAQFISDSLRGVGVACVVSDVGGTSRVSVLPGSEIRAREIVREVTEGTPPH